MQAKQIGAQRHEQRGQYRSGEEDECRRTTKPVRHCRGVCVGHVTLRYRLPVYFSGVMAGSRCLVWLSLVSLVWLSLVGHVFSKQLKVSARAESIVGSCVVSGSCIFEVGH